MINEDHLLHTEIGENKEKVQVKKKTVLARGKIVTARVSSLDVKGAVTLAVTISTLLLAITLLGSSSSGNVVNIIGIFGVFGYRGCFSYTIHNHCRKEQNRR